VEYVSAIVEIIKSSFFAFWHSSLCSLSCSSQCRCCRKTTAADASCGVVKADRKMVGLGTVALPIELIPAIDAVYDLLGFVLVGRRAGLFAFHNPRGVSCCFRRRRRLCRGPDSYRNSCASLFGLLLTDGRVASGDDLWR
jgi:hypothetical protein